MTVSTNAGWKLVPIEPTAAMLDRFVSLALRVSISAADGGWPEYARQQWAAMLAATPTPPIEGQDAGALLVGMAIEAAWNGSGSKGQRNNLPPIDLTDHEREHIGVAALQALGERG